MSKLPDFEGLAMFAKVAEERSFAAAARAMGVSVATVSRAVTRLEERLGGRLFNRTSRRLALTDYGHRLAERASRIYSEAEEAEEFTRETTSKPRGLVKLAAPLSFGARWVAPILPAFFRQYPDFASRHNRTSTGAPLFPVGLRNLSDELRPGHVDGAIDEPSLLPRIILEDLHHQRGVVGENHASL